MVYNGKHRSSLFITLVMFLLWDGFRLRTLIYKDGYVKGRLYQKEYHKYDISKLPKLLVKTHFHMCCNKVICCTTPSYVFELFMPTVAYLFTCFHLVPMLCFIYLNCANTQKKHVQDMFMSQYNTNNFGLLQD